MIGLAHHSLATAFEAARRCDPDEACLLTRSGPPTGCLVVAPSLGELLAARSYVEGEPVRILVVDCVPRLRTLLDVEIADAQAPAELVWDPVPIPLERLRRVLSLPAPPHPVLRTCPFNPVDSLVEEALGRGVLGAVLAYSRRIADSQARDDLYVATVALLTGNLSDTRYALRTRPRGGASAVLHEAMCDVLRSPQGRALGEAFRIVRRGGTAEEAAVETGADVFEVRYLGAKAGIKNK